MVKLLWMLCTAALLVSGCVAGVFDVEIPFNEGQIVANGFVGPEGTRLRLTRSVNPNDTIFFDAIPPVTGAEVTLRFDNGDYEQLTETGPGIYTSPLNVGPGTKLSVEITPDPNEEEHKLNIANVAVPELVESVSLTIENVDTFDGLSFKQYIIRTTIDILKSSSDQQPYIAVFAGANDIAVSSIGYSPLLAEDITSACGFVTGNWLAFPTYCYGGVV